MMDMNPFDEVDTVTEVGHRLSKDGLPPHDLDAEEATLGSLLIDPEAIYAIVGWLKAEDFYREKNRWAYECCVEINRRGEPINQILVAHELAKRKLLEAVGGADFLSHLVSQTPTSVHVEYYAKLVKNLSQNRRLISASNQIAALGYEGGDVDEALAKATDILLRIEPSGGKAEIVSMRDALNEAFELYGHKRGEGDPTAIYSGLTDLDEEIGGFHFGDFVVIGGRPGMGKTALMQKMARSIAGNQGKSCLFCSAEQSVPSLMARELARESGVSIKSLQRGLYSEKEADELMDAMGALSEHPIFWMAGRSLRVADVNRAARQMKQRFGIVAVFVDYLQLLIDEHGNSEVQRVSYISRNLKAIGQDLGVTVFVASQLNRRVEVERSNFRPRLSDFRESGAIEQDADVALLLYRDDHYYNQDDWETKYPDKPYPKGIAEINIAKNRQGASGQTKKVYWWAERMTFENLAKQ